MTNIKKKHDVDIFIWLSLCAFKRRKWRLNCKKPLDSLAWHSRVSPAPFIQVSITTWDAFKYFISVSCSFHTHTEQWRLVSAVFVCLFVYLFACLLLLLLFLRFFFFFNAAHSVTQCARVATRGLRVLIYMHELAHKRCPQPLRLPIGVARFHAFNKCVFLKKLLFTYILKTD